MCLLKPFEYATKELSGEKYVIISKIIPLINCLKTKVEAVQGTSENEFFKMSLGCTSMNSRSKIKKHSFQKPKGMSKCNSYTTQKHKDSERESDDSDTTTYDFWSHHKSLVHGDGTRKKAAESTKDELSLYLANPLTHLQADPIQQCEDMKNIFSTLYKIVRQYLSIPATSVPAEYLFSKAGVTLTKTRNRLLSKRLEKLLFLGDCCEEECGL
ncbi:hypothetical protein PR048_018768 [Dryococelus australis]|uniref:HAT C-terminal dimerisation domain-containing protein n=1 Tax=Dryococelus australis TaxID=614101 RepID=A0ABQ9HDG5_9NEOP|nr:hypothetical protein PR048_018768 [Dryococelus australis]